jgi:hypothetical protein
MIPKPWMSILETKNKEFWEAMAWWLAKEKRRHLDDVKRIDRDLDRLRKMEIKVPILEKDIWIEIPNKNQFLRLKRLPIINKCRQNVTSKCCGWSIRIIGSTDFIGEKNPKIMTCHYVCEKCGKPCDVK